MGDIHSSPEAIKTFAGNLSRYEAGMRAVKPGVLRKAQEIEFKINEEINVRQKRLQFAKRRLEECERSRRLARNHYSGNAYQNEEVNCDCEAQAFAAASESYREILEIRRWFHRETQSFTASASRFDQSLDVLQQQSKPELIDLAEKLEIYLGNI